MLTTTFIDDSERQQLILVVDAQCDHLRILEQTLINDTSRTQLIAISTTAEAIKFLRRQDQYTKAQRPDIVLMDMSLKNGQAIALLREIKSDSELRQIPTIILTAEASNSDILESYRHQCNSFILKPQDLNHLSEILKVIKSFWLELVTLPIQ